MMPPTVGRHYQHNTLTIPQWADSTSTIHSSWCLPQWADTTSTIHSPSHSGQTVPSQYTHHDASHSGQTVPAQYTHQLSYNAQTVESACMSTSVSALKQMQCLPVAILTAAICTPPPPPSHPFLPVLIWETCQNSISHTGHSTGISGYLS